MKRDKKLIKQILLNLEKSQHHGGAYSNEMIEKYDDRTIQNHFRLLMEIGYINAIDTTSKDGASYIPKNLTMAGHDYLERMQFAWWKRILFGLLEVSGKIIWIVVGSVITAFIAYLANKIWGICQ